MNRRLRVSLFAALVAVSACDDGDAAKKDEPAGGPVKLDTLGVQVDLPSGWSHAEKRGEQWVSRSMTYGAKLETVETMPASLEDAKKSLFLQGKATDEGKKGDALYAVIEADFGNMVLPYVFVVTPVGKAAVMCSGQLQEGDDAKALVDVCLTMKAL